MKTHASAKVYPQRCEAHLPPTGQPSLLLIAPRFHRRHRLNNVSYLAGTVNSPQLMQRIAGNSALALSATGPQYHVRVLDLTLAPHNFNLQHFLKRFSPTIIGVTSTTATIEQAIAIARMAKDAAPGALRIIGGYHASALPKLTLLSSSFHIAAIGYGEETLGELALAANHYGRQALLRELAKVSGIAYKDERGQIVINPYRDYQIELDAYPFPHSVDPLFVFDDFEYGEQEGLGKLDSITAARGCPYSCRYCAGEVVHQRRLRFRSAENVLAEISEQYDRGVRLLMFEEETFALHREVHEILAGIKAFRVQHPDFRWAVETRGDKLSLELVDEMVAAGLKQMAFGLESADEALARTVKHDPHLQMSHITAVVEKAEAAGVSVAFNLLVGFPGQTWQSILRTISYLLQHAPDRAVAGDLHLYAGTTYAQQAQQGEGITITKPHAWLPEFETAELTRAEIIRAINLMELVIYYIRWSKKSDDPEFKELILNNAVVAIVDTIRIATIYDLLIRSKPGAETRANRLRLVGKSADRIFQQLEQLRTKETLTAFGVLGTEHNQTFKLFECFDQFREALFIDNSIKINYLDHFLSQINFENAFELTGLPWPIIRMLFLTLNSLWFHYRDELNTTVLNIRIEDGNQGYRTIKTQLADKKVAALNAASESFDSDHIAEDGAEFEFFGLPFRFEAATQTLVVRASPSSL